jgi:DNA-directed RNA polymerase specialized sigma24 family protein
VEVSLDDAEPSLDAENLEWNSTTGAAAPGDSSQAKSPENLTRLILRLDRDTTSAWEKYQNIRCRLTKFFECNHFTGSEDLADRVLDRVAAKLESEEIREVAEFSIGVARFVCLEEQRRRKPTVYMEDLPGGGEGLPTRRDPSGEIVDKIDRERQLACLEPCLARLSPEDRRLVLLYYSAEDNLQIGFRKQLAESFDISLENLRRRACMIRTRLGTCIKPCMKSLAEARAGFVDRI